MSDCLGHFKSPLKSDIIYGCSLTLDTEDEVDADNGVEVSEDVEDELLDDFDKEVDTLTLTLGLGSWSDSSDSEFSFWLFKENGPKGILTNGVVVDSLAVEGLGVFLEVGMNWLLVTLTWLSTEVGILCFRFNLNPLRFCPTKKLTQNI